MTKNAISIDVEEYYHANNLNAVAPPASWHKLASTVEASTNKVLEVLEDTKATFFILGAVARRHPGLVKRISDSGHEIASHGYAHQLVYENSEKHFRRDLEKGKYLLEDICGSEVTGYRAPSFSIKDSTPWAYDVLTELGFKYDSSLHPIWHPRYANADKPRTAYKHGELWIVPIGTAEFFGKYRFPCAGGAYWRLFPKLLCKLLLQKAGSPFTTYFHPWELDTTQPKLKLGFPTSLRHYGGISSFPDTLRYYLRNFSFTTIKGAYDFE